LAPVYQTTRCHILEAIKFTVIYVIISNITRAFIDLKIKTFSKLNAEYQVRYLMERGGDELAERNLALFRRGSELNETQRDICTQATNMHYWKVKVKVKVKVYPRTGHEGQDWK
jgi:hypothetical protein